MRATSRFTRVNIRPPAGSFTKALRGWRIDCGRCPEAAEIADNSPTGMSGEDVARRFSERGWRVGKGARRHLCPGCQKAQADPGPPPNQGSGGRREPGDAGPSRPPSGGSSLIPPPAPVIAIRIVGEDMMTQHAEPPRAPTPEERRRVHDAIDDHWNGERGLYREDWSDGRLAEALDVPRRWVADMRELLFGPADACEAKADAGPKFDGFEARLAELEARGLQLAADAEALRREIAQVRKTAGI